MFAKRAFFPLALACTAANAMLAETSIVKIDESTAFRSTFALESETGTTQFQIELSPDLATWTPVDLVFTHDEWSVGGQTGLSVTSYSKRPDQTWDVQIQIPLEATTFARIVKLQGPFPADATVTAETRNLLANLHRIGWDPNMFAFGQEFPLSYREGDNAGNGDIEQSDSKDVVGDHPGVHGSDFLYMMDRPWEQDFHIAAAKRAYQDGAIVTFDFHWTSKYPQEGQQGYSPNSDANKILDHVVRNDDSRGDVTWFYQDLDRVLDLINNDLRFPIVFRPFHEMDGNWFWWGRQIDGGAETFREAYRLLVEYISERSDYVLFCWSPDVALANFEQFYPGDDYVDVVGRDIYSVGNAGRGFDKLTEMIAFAQARGKVAVFSETGYTAGGQSFELGDPDWWTTRILNPITKTENAGKIAWVLTWINANWSGPYIPHSGSPQAAKDDFTAFYNAPQTLFQQDVAALNVYAPPPSDEPPPAP